MTVTINEGNRLDALRSYEILDTDPEQGFDDLVRLAAQVCDVPIAAVTFVTAERQWLKAGVGLTPDEWPRDLAMCTSAAQQLDVFVIRDARDDPRFAGSPGVAGAPHLRFYAGAAVVDADGLPLGVIAVMDRVPRDVSPAQQDALSMLARQVVSQLEVRRSTRVMTRAVTAAKVIEEALEVSEAFKARVMEGSQDCISVLDREGRLLSMNAAGLHALEIGRFAALQNVPWIELWPLDSRDALRAALGTARRGGVGRFSGPCPTMRGNPRWWDVVLSAILDRDGRPHQLLAVSRDITERKRTKEMLQAITEGTGSALGTAFFSALVKHLAAALQVRHVFVAECARGDRARTLAFWSGYDFVANVEYLLAGTPCMDVFSGKVCCYADHLQQRFPTDHAAATLGAESYVGVPLLNSAGHAIGHLVVMDDQPMAPEPFWLPVLQAFAGRAAAELERQQSDQRLGEALAAVRLDGRAPEHTGSSPTQMATLREVERLHIEAVLGQTRGVIEGQAGAARILHVHPNTLRSRMKKLGVQRPRRDKS